MNKWLYWCHFNSLLFPIYFIFICWKNFCQFCAIHFATTNVHSLCYRFRHQLEFGTLMWKSQGNQVRIRINYRSWKWEYEWMGNEWIANREMWPINKFAFIHSELKSGSTYILYSLAFLLSCQFAFLISMIIPKANLSSTSTNVSILWFYYDNFELKCRLKSALLTLISTIYWHFSTRNCAIISFLPPNIFLAFSFLIFFRKKPVYILSNRKKVQK
jgi:hypothetical protein